MGDADDDGNKKDIVEQMLDGAARGVGSVDFSTDGHDRKREVQQRMQRTLEKGVEKPEYPPEVQSCIDRNVKLKTENEQLLKDAVNFVPVNPSAILEQKDIEEMKPSDDSTGK
jgi:hypothetical protein